MSDNLCIMGIDPGISGAIAFYFTDAPDRVSVDDVPTVAGEIDSVTLAERIRQMKPDVAIIEQVGAMPKQGVSSTFKFGMAFGVVKGVVSACQIPVLFVTPATWKKAYKLTADKEQARRMALRLFPKCDGAFGRKKDHGRAEAALLARYGAIQWRINTREAGK